MVAALHHCMKNGGGGACLRVAAGGKLLFYSPEISQNQTAAPAAAVSAKKIEIPTAVQLQLSKNKAQLLQLANAAVPKK